MVGTSWKFKENDLCQNIDQSDALKSTRSTNHVHPPPPPPNYPPNCSCNLWTNILVGDVSQICPPPSSYINNVMRPPTLQIVRAISGHAFFVEWYDQEWCLHTLLQLLRRHNAKGRVLADHLQDLLDGTVRVSLCCRSVQKNKKCLWSYAL